MRAVSVVDYGMGNVFSVLHACRSVGLDASLTEDPEAVAEAEALIIPGVGAMPDAMTVLRSRGLDAAIVDSASRGTPVLGICLGFHLLMSNGTEFGEHEGLGLLPGTVLRLPETGNGRGGVLPVPNVGWRKLSLSKGAVDSPFDVLHDGSQLYFVHSFYVKPDPTVSIVATSSYGDFAYCAAARSGSIFGCQFHPERSARIGLSVLERFAALISAR